MTTPRGWVLRLTVLGVALAVSLSDSAAQAQTRTRTVNRSRFVNLVTSPLQSPTLTTFSASSSILRQPTTTAAALPANVTVLPQIVTFKSPVGFGGGSGFLPSGNPTPFADPNPSPSE